MAPKRPSPLDDPPAASSSEEEKGEASSSEEEGSSEEEEEEAEPENASALPSTPVTDKKPTSKKPDSEPQSSSSESGSDSDADSGDAPNTSVRPIASKPMEDPAPKAATKPRSKTASSAARSAAAAAKRQASEADGKDSSKRAKKKGPEPSVDGVVSPDDSKKSALGDEKKLFQRLWSEDDEIAILKGMLEYTAKRGADPSADASAFHEFVKNSLHVDVSKTQVMDKIRRLKKKYKNNAERAKKGKEPTFSKLHEQKAYDLSKKIWGSAEDPNGVEPVVEAAKSNGKSAKKKSSQKANVSRSLKEELYADLSHEKNVTEKMEIDGNQGSGLGSERCLNGMLRFDKNMGVVSLDESLIKGGLDLIGEDKKAELERRWREVEMAELEIFVKRTELVRDQAKLIWEAYRREADGH